MIDRKPRTFVTALIGSDGSMEEARTTCLWDPANPAVPGYVSETAAAMRSAAAARHDSRVTFAPAAPAVLVDDATPAAA